MSAVPHECPVCLDTRVLRVVPCGNKHAFCEDCIERLIVRYPRMPCPMCRKTFQLTKNVVKKLPFCLRPSSAVVSSSHSSSLRLRAASSQIDQDWELAVLVQHEEEKGVAYSHALQVRQDRQLALQFQREELVSPAPAPTSEGQLANISLEHEVRQAALPPQMDVAEDGVLVLDNVDTLQDGTSASQHQQVEDNEAGRERQLSEEDREDMTNTDELVLDHVIPLQNNLTASQQEEEEEEEEEVVVEDDEVRIFEEDREDMTVTDELILDHVIPLQNNLTASQHQEEQEEGVAVDYDNEVLPGVHVVQDQQRVISEVRPKTERQLSGEDPVGISDANVLVLDNVNTLQNNLTTSQHQQTGEKVEENSQVGISQAAIKKKPAQFKRQRKLSEGDPEDISDADVLVLDNVNTWQNSPTAFQCVKTKVASKKRLDRPRRERLLFDGNTEETVHVLLRREKTTLGLSSLAPFQPPSYENQNQRHFFPPIPNVPVNKTSLPKASGRLLAVGHGTSSQIPPSMPNSTVPVDRTAPKGISEGREKFKGLASTGISSPRQFPQPHVAAPVSLSEMQAKSRVREEHAGQLKPRASTKLPPVPSAQTTHTSEQVSRSTSWSQYPPLPAVTQSHQE